MLSVRGKHIDYIDHIAGSISDNNEEREREREREREIREMLPVVANIVFREDARIGEGFDFLPGPTW